MKKQAKDGDFKDPVCGMVVSRMTAVDEKTYYFCAGSCRQAFEAAPEKYIKHHRQHGMKSG